MSDDNGVRTDQDDAAHRMLNKLRQFVDQELAPDERQALAALLAPGVASAYQNDDVDEVVGFQAPTWMPEALPEHLSEAIRDRDLHIEGL